MTDRLKTVYPPKTSFCGGYKEILKALGGVDALPTTIVYKQWSKNGYVEICCKVVKNYFFSIIILHAHLQYVWNMSAKY